jgi:hypothetical protein
MALIIDPKHLKPGCTLYYADNICYIQSLSRDDSTLVETVIPTVYSNLTSLDAVVIPEDLKNDEFLLIQAGSKWAQQGDESFLLESASPLDTCLPHHLPYVLKEQLIPREGNWYLQVVKGNLILEEEGKPNRKWTYPLLVSGPDSVRILMNMSLVPLFRKFYIGPTHPLVLENNRSNSWTYIGPLSTD